MMREYKRFTRAERYKLEALLEADTDKKEIARILNKHISSIYREIKRGEYKKLDSATWEEKTSYSPDIAQDKFEANQREKGSGLKIGNDIEFANFIEQTIIEKRYSPDAALAEAKKKGFNMTICVKTLYSYIDKGIFLNLTNKHLPVKRNQGRKNNKVRVQKRANAGTSIELRDEKILEREEFGNWEMDTVVGKRGKSKKSLLVLTERRTRNELIFLLEEHKAVNVVEVLDFLELKYGNRFSTLFKSITVDNGTEFSYFEEMQKSKLFDGDRTKIYYCHPYSSYERGSNENCNKLIRRHIPKGMNFDNYTQKEINVIMEWINHYPRKIFGYSSASELYKNELELLGMAV
jgi:IS30 family transposase